MNMQTQQIRDTIIEAFLPDAAFDGWTRPALERAAQTAGYEPGMVAAVFPDGVSGAMAHFADWADRGMMAKIEGMEIETMRVRDRIRTAVLARLDVLEPHREAVRLASAGWTVRGLKAGKVLWRTADKIWNWAGDTATDYNRYTKRALLCAVLGSTVMAWLNDGGRDRAAVEAFLDRRIEHVMQLGRAIGKIKPRKAS
jgi:ubiquinone biosynthesis protein COQ9